MPVQNQVERTKPRLLCEKEVSHICGMSVSWLQKRRVHGDGPPFIKMGRSVRYRCVDIEAYLERQRRKSTSDKPDNDGGRNG